MIKIERSFYLKLLLLSVWFSYFLSINLNPAEFSNFNLFNKIRLLLPIFLTILFIKFKYEEIKFSNLLDIHSSFFYIIFFLYIIFNITFHNNNFINIYWPLYMALSFFILHNLTNYEEKKNLLILTVFIVGFGFAFYFSSSLIELANRPRFHFYGIMGSELGYLNLSNPPRSSGLARLALILFSFLLYYYLIKEKKNNYIYLILICFLGTSSLIFQSRAVSFIYIILNIFIIVFYFKKFFKDKWLIIFAIILPLLINFIYNYNLLKNTNIVEKNIVEKNENNLTVAAWQNVILRDYNSHKKNPLRFSSNRFDNWNKAINIIKKKLYQRLWGTSRSDTYWAINS